MSRVTIRDLRNNGGEIVDRAASGEEVTITRAGKPVATLHAIGRNPMPAEMLLARWKQLPRIDAARLRADLDDALDASL